MASSTGAPASRLPAEITSFVGRRDDLASVRQLFSTSRLVTLTGVGGVGKTRLALRAAEEMRRAFPDGVWMVELASLRQAELLAQTVIDALRIPERPHLDATATLEDYVSERRLLMVLDNCEHLIEPVADLADRLLRAAPEIRILATSRQAMRIAGEQVYPVPPLAAPDPALRLEAGASTRYPSVALFAERAHAVVPDFAITSENEADVVRLCHRLEGIPLALELASVRLRVLTVEELADRLDDRFHLLREGSRNLPERHQTLRALIDWSHELCTLLEQTLWARASVFAGGFSMDALESICADSALPREAVLDTAAGLVDKSILLREQHGKHVRFRMLDTIRDYGATRLAESGETEAFTRRHRDWFSDLVERATREWMGPQQESWATSMHLDHPNIRLALEFSMSRPDEVGIGIEMAAQPWFWAATDHLNEASLWLDRGLAQLTEPSHPHAWALANRGYIAAFQGDDDRLRVLPERASDMARGINDAASLAVATHVMGFRQSLERGDIRRSIPLFEEAMRQYDDAGMSPHFHEVVVVELATTYVLLQEYDRATRLVEELHARCTAIGERWHLSYALWLRSLIALLSDNRTEDAERDLLEALRIKRVFRDTLGIGLSLEVLGWVAAAKGEGERSAMVIGGADQVWETVGSRQLGGKHARFEALARAAIGDAHFEAARERGRRLSTDEVIAYALHEGESASEPAAGVSPLTKREREVAELVAHGMSNREIAERLVISLRTAEGHVEKILSKQGFKTRTQIASWVTRQRSAPR